MNIILKLSENISKEVFEFSNSISKIIVKSHDIPKQITSYTKSYSNTNDIMKQDWKKINNDYSAIGNDMRKAIVKYAK